MIFDLARPLGFWPPVRPGCGFTDSKMGAAVSINTKPASMVSTNRVWQTLTDGGFACGYS
ncbi:hypothetical protein AS9A_2275 [Hoyosella subflava DQS3-9A1]|uniref:Uncharacterized protein n=1 Tax=Hoyosella subflava (strain DSM 45089 / JCM 17490 / NBRC 109087 / DQS3-9A1) TaxID=443218 RepID=F6ER35_HOYSD|nr:hypothetical protein AS9A_2275 [Hoyosella subflava DQS3-9A1]